MPAPGFQVAAVRRALWDLPNPGRRALSARVLAASPVRFTLLVTVRLLAPDVPLYTRFNGPIGEQQMNLASETSAPIAKQLRAGVTFMSVPS
jgi:hypothetical protein